MIHENEAEIQELKELIASCKTVEEALLAALSKPNCGARMDLE